MYRVRWDATSFSVQSSILSLLCVNLYNLRLKKGVRFSHYYGISFLNLLLLLNNKEF